MYISSFTAFNYRSLRHVKVRLENGRNVIVGKNNCGKSNIIKGLEILVGERFPTYQNITDNDFYTYENVDLETGELTEIAAEDFYLEAELKGKDFNEEIIKSIKKKTAFSKMKSSKELYPKKEGQPVNINYDFFQSLDEMEQRKEVATFDRNGRPTKVAWLSTNELLQFLQTSKRTKLFFCKSRLDPEKAGFGLICVDSNSEIWVSHFLSKKLRDSLITTTVISALRSQKEDLRLVHYTWFGKLIMGLWEKYKDNLDPLEKRPFEELIKEKSIDIKRLVDAVFAADIKEIRGILEGAIAHKAISFKFLNDTTSELYKNVQLFVNDGIDRPLNEKGTGIQSALIIALFSLYCNNFHHNSSLLIAEEPELFLHPQARRVISAELEKFIEESLLQPRQLIISTHSTEFLKNVDPFHIIRVYKDPENNCSITYQLDSDTSRQLTTELKRFLWSNNTELFFSDKAVLVEGGEVYLIPAIVDRVTSQKQLLDYQNITVTRVNGKGSFLTYIKMLECFHIDYILLGDLDCFKDELAKIVKHLELDSIKKDIATISQTLANLPVNYSAIEERIAGMDKNHDVQNLKDVFEKFARGEIGRDDPDLLSLLTYMETRFTKGDKYTAIVDKMGKSGFTKTLTALRERNIFIWSKGDLESCYSEKAKAIAGSKDMKALELSYMLQDPKEPMEDLFVNVKEIKNLVALILGKEHP